jgi:hypothetical protein
VQELIPEFYHGDGDFLRNSAGLELGLRADGRPVRVRYCFAVVWNAAHVPLLSGG